MRGRIPSPTAIKLLQGNPGRRPLNSEEPETGPLSINAPERVEEDPELKEFYNAVGNIVRAMNVAQESDSVALELMSMCLAEARRAYQQLELSGRTVTYESGAEQVSPHFTIFMKTMSQAISLMKEFGMTPASRSRVKTLATGDKKSKLSQFIDGEGG